MSTVILFSLGEKQASIDWRNYNCLAKIRTSGICRLVNFDNNVPVFTNQKESGDCSDFGNYERQKILESAQHHYSAF
jgi:hypothetical protein